MAYRSLQAMCGRRFLTSSNYLVPDHCRVGRRQVKGRLTASAIRMPHLPHGSLRADSCVRPASGGDYWSASTRTVLSLDAPARARARRSNFEVGRTQDRPASPFRRSSRPAVLVSKELLGLTNTTFKSRMIYNATDRWVSGVNHRELDA